MTTRQKERTPRLTEQADGKAGLSSAPDPTSSATAWLTLVALALLVVSCFLRFWRLGSLPGINGDEAWLGSQVAHWLQGAPFTWHTPTGNPINPFFLTTEALLLLAFPPDFLLLRLPAALWAVAGLAGSAWFARHLYGRWQDGLLLATMMACLPPSIEYARLGWDPSFIFVTTPLVLFPALRLAEEGAGRRDACFLAVGVFLAVWVHFSSLAFVALMMGCVGWVRLPGAIKAVRSWARSGRPLTGHGVMATGVAVLALSAVAIPLAMRKVSLALVFAAVAEGIGELGQQPLLLLDHGLRIGEILSGFRSGAYLAGLSEGSLTAGAAMVCAGLFLGLSLLLTRQRQGRDRCLGWMGLASFATVTIGYTSIFKLMVLGLERYVLWLLPLFALLLTRGLIVLGEGVAASGQVYRRGAAAAILGLAACGLLGTWAGYFVPLQEPPDPTLHRTFRTGPEEPKAVAARMLRELGQDNPAATAIIAEDWWLEHPLRFLLEPGITIHGAADSKGNYSIPSRLARYIAVCWEGTPFQANFSQTMTGLGYTLERREVTGVDNLPLLHLLIATQGQQ